MPLEFQALETPIFQDSRQLEGGKVTNPTHRPALSAREYSWYSFLLEAELTLGK